MGTDIGDGIRRRRATERHVTLADGPVPEMIAGAVVFAVFASYLAVIPQVGAFMSTTANTAIVIAAGAIIGAVVSWLANRGPRRVTVRSEAPIREDRAAA